MTRTRRLELEAILHPLIRTLTIELATRAGGPYQILVVPLLVETGFNALVDRVLVVDCPENRQRDRLLARDDETPERIDRILSTQAEKTRTPGRRQTISSTTPERLEQTRMHVSPNCTRCI